MFLSHAYEYNLFMGMRLQDNCAVISLIEARHIQNRLEPHGGLGKEHGKEDTVRCFMSMYVVVYVKLIEVYVMIERDDRG